MHFPLPAFPTRFSPGSFASWMPATSSCALSLTKSGMPWLLTSKLSFDAWHRRLKLIKETKIQTRHLDGRLHDAVEWDGHFRICVIDPSSLSVRSLFSCASLVPSLALLFSPFCRGGMLNRTSKTTVRRKVTTKCITNGRERSIALQIGSLNTTKWMTEGTQGGS